MLAKLLKYEIKATARWFIPLYAALVLFTLISRFLLYNDPYVTNEATDFWQIARILSISIYAFLFIGIMVVTFVVIIQRFYKNLLGDEGYLMFTLPVQAWKHIVSKLLIAMLWNFLSAVIGMCSVMLLIPAQDLADFGLLVTGIKKYFGTIGYFSFSLLTIISLVFSIIEMYAAIALGHLFRKHKLLASFGMYIGLNTVSQMAFMLIIPFLMNIIGSLSDVTPGRLNTLILMSIIIFALLSTAWFIVTNLILKRKLNLE